MKIQLSFICILLIFNALAAQNSFRSSPILASRTTKTAKYSTKYISEQRGNFKIETPEVHELIQIIIALTPTGLRDSNMVEHASNYYKNVVRHFQPFTNSTLVLAVDKLLQQGYYTDLRMDSYAFVFDESGQIRNSGMFDKLSAETQNTMRPLLKDLEKFAEKSNFRSFYTQNSTYLKMSREFVHRYVPIFKYWNWYESHFDARHDSYKMIFSPLVNNTYATTQFENKDFKETLLFTAGAYKNPLWNEPITEGVNSRVVFTEMGQNYVHEIAEKHAERIENIFSDRLKWSNNPDLAKDIFNEYMTKAVFSLYCLDTFGDSDDFKAINERTERAMKLRGNKQFKVFNDQLLVLYKNATDKKVETLLPLILDWAETQ